MSAESTSDFPDPSADPDGFSVCTLSASDEDIGRAVQLLKAGNVVAIPTETVYGLAGNALDESACRRIFEVKGRPLIDPLIVHVATMDQAHSVGEMGLAAAKLAEQFWPGPLTMVVPKQAVVPAIVTAGLTTVAVRMPSHPVARKLLQRLPFPVAAPSANPFGYVSPTTSEHVRDSLGGRIPAILEGGPCEVGVESTIVDLTHEEPVILRPGAVSAEDVANVLGVAVKHAAKTVVEDQPKAPGLLERHYSPATPLDLFEGQPPGDRGSGDALVFLQRPEGPARQQQVFWLSEKGDLGDVARNLFGLLRQLDRLPAIHHIWCERPVSDEGIARAINDRLQRAAKR